MSTLRRFSCFDLFKFSNVNLDYFTETFHFPFYFEYLSKWPEFCFISEDSNGRVEGYHFGKSEGPGQSHHGHLTAITIAREFRRIGVTEQFMNLLKQISEEHNGRYIDLFVRKSNENAIKMYNKHGYIVYREILDELYDVQTSENEIKKIIENFLKNHSIYFLHMNSKRYGLTLYDGTIIINKIYYGAAYTYEFAFIILWTLLHEIMHILSRLMRKDNNFFLDTGEFTMNKKIFSQQKLLCLY